MPALQDASNLSLEIPGTELSVHRSLQGSEELPRMVRSGFHPWAPIAEAKSDVRVRRPFVSQKEKPCLQYLSECRRMQTTK